MAERKTVVLIGAGSAAFTQGLVADFLRSGTPWELRLVDIDRGALETAEGLARRMVEARDADVAVKVSTDRVDMLPGADVVVTTVGVGGRRAWEADVLIPRKYGVYQPVGDTIMSGGVSRAMRMIPAMVDIANDVVRYAPGARFFNYANPMTANCWAMRKATKAEVVGLCIGTAHVVWELADLMGAPRHEVTALAAGVNHFTWIYDLRWRGRDAWPIVRAAATHQCAPGAHQCAPGAHQCAPGAQAPDGDVAPGGDSTLAEPERGQVAYNPFSWSLFDAYGAYPAVNDRHVVEFWPERFPGGRYQGKTLGVDVMVFEDIVRHGDAHYDSMRRQATGEAPLDEAVFERGVGEHSQLTEIIGSIAADDRSTYFANLPNHGAVPNLPYDAVLEMTSVATGRGLTPVRAIGYSDALAATQARKIAGIEVTVEAALCGSRALFVEALLIDGSVNDRRVAQMMADELLAAHQAYLPQFA